MKIFYLMNFCNRYVYESVISIFSHKLKLLTINLNFVLNFSIILIVLHFKGSLV